MPPRIYPVLEHPVQGFTFTAGSALVRVVESHDDLSPLLDFHAPDPAQIAIEVGMVYPYEEDGADDLAELDLGQPEWHEPAVGLAVVRHALDAVRGRPESIGEAIYDPGLRPQDVLADLEALEMALELARQHETRFRLVMDDCPPGLTRGGRVAIL